MSNQSQVTIEDLVQIGIASAYAIEFSEYNVGEDLVADLPPGASATGYRLAWACSAIAQFCRETGYTYKRSEFIEARDVVLYFAQTAPWHVTRFYKPQFAHNFDFRVKTEGDGGRAVEITAAYDFFARDMRILFRKSDLRYGAEPRLSQNSLARRAVVLKKMTTLDYKGGVK